MEEDIKCTEPSISLSVGDEIVGCLDTKYEVLRIDYKDLTVTFTDEKTGARLIRSFRDIACEFKKSEKSYCRTEDIKVTLGIRGTISLEVGDKLINCMNTEYTVVSVNYIDQIVTFTEEKTGIDRIRSFSDISCELKKIVKPCYNTVDIEVARKSMANISLNEGDCIIVDKGNKAKVLSIDYLKEKVTISKYGDCSTLTFDEIECGNYKKVIY